MTFKELHSGESLARQPPRPQTLELEGGVCSQHGMLTRLSRGVVFFQCADEKYFQSLFPFHSVYFYFSILPLLS